MKKKRLQVSAAARLRLMYRVLLTLTLIKQTDERMTMLTTRETKQQRIKVRETMMPTVGSLLHSWVWLTSSSDVLLIERSVKLASVGWVKLASLSVVKLASLWVNSYMSTAQAGACPWRMWLVSLIPGTRSICGQELVLLYWSSMGYLITKGNFSWMEDSDVHLYAVKFQGKIIDINTYCLYSTFLQTCKQIYYISKQVKDHIKPHQ